MKFLFLVKIGSSSLEPVYLLHFGLYMCPNSTCPSFRSVLLSSPDLKKRDFTKNKTVTYILIKINIQHIVSIFKLFEQTRRNFWGDIMPCKRHVRIYMTLYILCMCFKLSKVGMGHIEYRFLLYVCCFCVEAIISSEYISF